MIKHVGQIFHLNEKEHKIVRQQQMKLWALGHCSVSVSYVKGYKTVFTSSLNKMEVGPWVHGSILRLYKF